MKTDTEDRRSDWDAAHAEILEAAHTLFTAGGADAITMSAVAAEASLNRTTVHRHFATRTDLLWAVTMTLVENMGVAISGAMDDASLDEHIDEFVASFVDDPTGSSRALVELATGRDDGTGVELLAGERAMMEMLAGSGRARPGLDADVLAVVLLAGTLLWSARSEAAPEAASRFALEIKRLLLHGAMAPHSFRLADEKAAE